MTELGEGSEDSRRRVAVGELVPEGAAAGSVEALLRPARRGAPRHARRRLCRGGARGADPRVATAAPLARRGPRRDPRAPAARRRRAAVGRRRPGAVRPLPRRPARRRARARRVPAGPAQRHRARVPRRRRRGGRPRAPRRATDEPPPPGPAGGRGRAPRRRAPGRRARRPLAQHRPGRRARRRGAGADGGRAAHRRAVARRPDPRAVDALRGRGGRGGGHRRDPRRPARRAAAQLGGGPQPAVVVGQRSRAPPSADGLLASTDAAGVVRFIDLRTWAPSGAPVQAGTSHRLAGPSPSRPTGGRSPW